MNIKTKKVAGSFLIFFLFWTLIILAGFLLLDHTGGSGGGKGSGYGGSGNGAGSGYSSGGSGSGQGGTASSGSGAGSQKNMENGKVNTQVKTSSKADTKGKTPVKNPPPQQKNTPPPAESSPDHEGAIRVMDNNSKNTDTATFYLPQKVPVGKSGNAGTSKGFFGVEVGGEDKVIFLLDVSGSMATTTPDGNSTRLQLVKNEMANSLKSGYRDAENGGKRGYFRIATFSNDCSFFPEKKTKYYFRKRKEILDAIAFVNSLKSGGATNMRHAWGMLLPIIREQQIRTVYFLSDGEPTDCSPQSLLQFLNKEFPTLKIHTFSLGMASTLLKDIAKSHNGVYREIF
ncbi:MAG: VWA domain-containing protein [Lentisphaeria bacterium]|nr:VWA domain-containing protein [Lentisphaeria bacterium]MBO5760786.1 VWA domain-containing protein [Lentisphaeria bacterium]